MTNKLFRMFLNIFILFGCVGIFINLSPFASKQISAVFINTLKLSSPVCIAEELKEEYGLNKNEQPTNNTTDPIQQTKPVMRPTRVEDSKTDMDITKTPKDILELMNKAKGEYDESSMDGKTSEEPYFGGGRLVSYKDIEVQSKIPEPFYKMDIEKLLKQGSDLKITDKTKPTVLIYHSHTTEAYSLLDTGFYNNANSRSNDADKSVVRVGDEIVNELEKAGFNVIHDKEIHDYKYGESYASSKASVEKYLEEYPSIEVTIDVHRDTITYSNKTKVKPTAKIKGKKAARMMIISGCEYGRVKNYPDWEYNLRFNLAVQNKLAAKYPGLMRPVMFSERKYNMNMTHNSFLLEVGSDANTLEEACYSGRLFGNALGELMNEKYVKE